jgi:hypothetical protein
MFLSALLNSLGQNVRRQSRRSNLRTSSVVVELCEERLVLSNLSLFPPIAPSNGQPNPPGISNPLTSIPQLNSLPGAPVTIYLDFDGHTETQDWPNSRSDGQSGPVVTPVFDVDNDLTTFSDEELRMIEEVWYRVSEDFSPFNINVTTVDPGTYRDFEAILVSFGGDGAWIGSPGGIAYLNSFNGGPVNTSYVFTDNTGRGGIDHMKGTAMAASHEVGHMLGLNHHAVYDANGTMTAQYDSGRPDLGPIMGAPYGSERETWSNAPDNSGPNNFQDDLVIITGTRNRTIQFRTDDHGNTRQTATNLMVSSPVVSGSGVIERNDDIDMFRFQTDTGTISFSVDGLNLRTVFNLTNVNYGTNLDLVLRLYDANGALVASSDPANSLSASVTASVNQGTYYLGVSGTGQYGAIGQYSFTGTVIPLPAIPTMLSPTGEQSSPAPVFSWTVGANSVAYELEVDNLTTGQTAYYARTVVANTHIAEVQFPEGEYQARVRTVAANGSRSGWSNVIEFSIDVPNPSVPTIRRPTGDTGDSFPTFEWTTSSNGSYYTLEVHEQLSADSTSRVIFKTNYSSTTYTHFSPLKDATYSARVQAFNLIGEASAWSDTVTFTIDAPIPAAPRLTAPSSVTTGINPRHVWTPVDGAARYDLWVNSLTENKSQYLRRESLPKDKNYFDPPRFAQGNYVAWVRAINGNGEAGPWSVPYNYTVDVLPPTTSMMTGPVGEGNSLTVATINPTFTWTAATRAVRYDLWVNNMSTLQAQIIRRSDITTNSFTSISNLPQGNYRAWVRGINSANEYGEWSRMYEFSIDEATPDTPTLIGPVANPAGSVENANPTFVWTSKVKAPFYELQIDNVSLNQKNVISVKGITEESYTIPNAQRFGEYTYQARVRGYNLSGDLSDWSPSFRIRIDVPSPTTPAILGPKDSSNDRTPQFSWVHTKSSFRYEILVRDLERNENIVLNVVTFTVNPEQTEAYYVLPDAQAFRPGTYRFWIRAFNSLGQSSSWSAAQAFVITASNDLELNFDAAGLSLFAKVDGEQNPEHFLLTARRAADTQQSLEAPGNAQPMMTAPVPAAQVMADDQDSAAVDAAMELVANPASDFAAAFEAAPGNSQSEKKRI